MYAYTYTYCWLRCLRSNIFTYVYKLIIRRKTFYFVIIGSYSIVIGTPYSSAKYYIQYILQVNWIGTWFYKTDNKLNFKWYLKKHIKKKLLWILPWHILYIDIAKNIFTNNHTVLIYSSSSTEIRMITWCFILFLRNT